MRHHRHHIESAFLLPLLRRAMAVALCIFIVALLPLSAQEPTKEYQVKAAFLFNFTQFVDWPASSFGSSGEPFVIGVLGDNPFGRYLNDVVAEEKVGGHPIVVRTYYDAREAGKCHLLYVNSSDPAWTRTALASLAGRSILTVGDTYEFLDAGGMIRFVLREGKVRFQINNRAAKGVQLSISSKLLRVAESTD